MEKRRNEWECVYIYIYTHEWNSNKCIIIFIDATCFLVFTMCVSVCLWLMIDDNGLKFKNKFFSSIQHTRTHCAYWIWCVYIYVCHQRKKNGENNTVLLELNMVYCSMNDERVQPTNEQTQKSSSSNTKKKYVYISAGRIKAKPFKRILEFHTTKE